MSLPRARRLTLAALCALTLGAAGCGSSPNAVTPPGASTTPVTTPPCAHDPEGVAQDGVNDDQGGSIPGVNPCGGPGN